MHIGETSALFRPPAQTWDLFLQHFFTLNVPYKIYVFPPIQSRAQKHCLGFGTNRKSLTSCNCTEWVSSFSPHWFAYKTYRILIQCIQRYLWEYLRLEEEYLIEGITDFILARFPLVPVALSLSLSSLSLFLLFLLSAAKPQVRSCVYVCVYVCVCMIVERERRKERGEEREEKER